jgi:hypothetical protein
MTTEEIIIAAVRVLGSLPVLAWPFPGAIIAILTDLSDLFLRDALHLGGVRNYQTFDKWLDQVYMLTFLVVALRWQGTPRNIAVILYAYRLVGFVAFEVTEERDVLLAFPNVFEYWFVFVAAIKHFHWEDVGKGPQPDPSSVGKGPSPDDGRLAGLIPFRYSQRQLAVVLPVLLAAKMAHEYSLHGARIFDDFTALEAVEWMWRTLTPPY